mmetsp:Transcript_32018/g.97691  ORF Transcript_32018/g.97691 Transcript_32018/m.97691 type:complete len:81 (-) Transcript_32018:1442-1684(-)
MRCNSATRAVTTAGALERVWRFSTSKRERHLSIHARASRDTRSPGASRVSLLNKSTKLENRCAQLCGDATRDASGNQASS